MKARKRLALCIGFAFLCVGLLAPIAAQAAFGINSLKTEAIDKEGLPELRAGAHPYAYTVSFDANLKNPEEPAGNIRSLLVELPPGIIGNPQATPRCPGTTFDGQAANCPSNTQIGVANIKLGGELPPVKIAVYSLAPSLGTPFTAGFSVLSHNSFQEASLRTGSDYGVTVADITLPTDIPILAVSETIWGEPADAGHDAERFPCLIGGGSCPTDISRLPFLTLPTSCGAPLVITVRVESLEEPGSFQEESAESLGFGGIPAGIDSCERPAFDPTLTVKPETSASDSPTGLHVNVHIPQNEAPEGIATAHLKDTVVTLPAGVALNPSTADGLGACSSAQIDLKGPGPAQCPASSKVGTVKVETPLLDHPVPGAVYVARQVENPFGSLLAIYIVAEDPLTGVIVKLAGEVQPDPVTGQLETSFLENPQLPFEDFDVDFFGGPRAALTTPSTCGTYTTQAELTPWTAPEGPQVSRQSSFPITSSPTGGLCADTEAQMPNGPSLQAGTSAPVAGAYSPLLFKASRENGSQRFGAIAAALPPGLIGRLAGLTPCSDTQLAVAASRNQPGQGALEKQSPSCPSSSEIGTVTAGAGSGTPLSVQGHAYLAGPYKGAPISLAFITPAVAGPFDLGTVVVRAAGYLNRQTAQITVKSDPIPQILHGIPLDVRAIAVNADRPQFTLNPTSCDPMSFAASAISTLGQSAALSNPFQVGGCRGLGFRPGLALRLKGGTKRGANPKLIATLSPREGDADIAALSVKLPPSAFLDQSHIRTVCTRVQFAADACPNGSVYGRVSVQTPLLDYPLTGNVYLRSSNHKLPDLITDLRGPASQPIRIELAGRTDSIKGALRNSFDFVPDAPFSMARLELFGGKRGLVVNSRNLCAHAYRATVKYEAHSGAGYEAKPLVQNSCGKGKAKDTRRRGARG